jgi:protein-L-isoaspartate(D-aspartate) O-methyltransferase
MTRLRLHPAAGCGAEQLPVDSVSFLDAFLRMAWRTVAESNAALIAGLKREGIIASPLVEKAMLAVDRGVFIPQSPYVDSPQNIAAGQTISAPHMHAYALEALKEAASRPNAKLLDVGSGSGYFCALLAAANPTAHVVAIEVVPELVELSKKNLAKWNGVERLPDVRQGNGWEALGDEEYDAIHVGAAAATLPKALVKALKVGGVLLIPIGPHDETQYLTVVRKRSRDDVTEERLMGVRYVPLVTGRQ